MGNRSHRCPWIVRPKLHSLQWQFDTAQFWPRQVGMNRRTQDLKEQECVGSQREIRGKNEEGRRKEVRELESLNKSLYNGFLTSYSLKWFLHRRCYWPSFIGAESHVSPFLHLQCYKTGLRAKSKLLSSHSHMLFYSVIMWTGMFPLGADFSS